MPFESLSVRNVLGFFGPRKTNLKFGGSSMHTESKVIKYVFDYNDLPVGGANNLGLVIPANSTILGAKLRILSAFTSTLTTTDLQVGLQNSAGTEIDNDGLITAAQATQTAIGVVNSIIDGASGTPGALIGKTIGAANGEIAVVPNVNDLTAGRAEIIVEYYLPVPASL